MPLDKIVDPAICIKFIKKNIKVKKILQTIKERANIIILISNKYFLTILGYIIIFHRMICDG